MRFKVSIFFLVFTIVSSCSPQSELSEGNDADFFEFLFDLGYPKEKVPSLGTYVIIPSDICHTCVEKLKYYVSTNKNAKYTTFVLVGRSIKTIRLLFSKDLMKNNNVYLDSEGAWYNSDFAKNSGAALLFYTNGNSVTKVIELKPSQIDFVLHDLSYQYN